MPDPGTKSRRPLFALTAGLLAGALVATPAAATPAAPADAATLATTLTARLGDRAAGSWVDDAGRAVVAVTDRATAAEVRAAGAVARQVARSGAALASADATLRARLTQRGTAFAVDPVANQVVVSHDSTVTGARLAAVRALVATLGDAARLQAVPGTLSKRLSGGDAIYARGGGRCSLGFNVRSGSTYYFLTAGHCTDIGSSWSASSGGPVIGNTTGSSFPGDDYGIVRYAAGQPTPPGTVANVDITAAGTPSVGQTVTRRGSTTGTRSGRVTALNATVNYAEGRVSGLIQTTVCAEPGDSGGPLYAGSTAYGLTSGGSGNCRTGGTTFFQPVTEALSVYRVSVY